MNTKIKGIALIQVLIITMILTILGIYMTQSVRRQVDLAFDMEKNVSLNLAIENAQAQLIHAMLTNKLYINKNSTNEIVSHWNFYNKPFQLDEKITVKLQDINGLLSINMMNSRLANQVFENLGQEGHPVRTILDSLKDWIDPDSFKYLNGAEDDYYRMAGQLGPRNGYLQSLDEIHSVRMGNIIPLSTWEKYFTVETNSGFNPLTAPDLILKSIIQNDDLFNEVKLARDSDELTTLLFYQMTGIDGDLYYNFATGWKIKVELLAKSGKHQLSKQFVIEISPYEQLRTVIITDITWNKV